MLLKYYYIFKDSERLRHFAVIAIFAIIFIFYRVEDCVMKDGEYAQSCGASVDIYQFIDVVIQVQNF